MNTFSPDYDDEKSVIVLTPETNTVELMESRIRQQSELIAMIKKRSDGLILELNNRDKKIKEMEEENAKLERSLKTVQNECKTIKERFSVLSHNHDEMIKLKNEYKTENQRLSLEHQSILKGKSECVSTVRGLEADKGRLEHDLRESQTENEAMRYKLSKMESDLVDQKKNANTDTDIILSLKRQLEETKIELTDSYKRFRVAQAELTVMTQKCAVIEADNLTMKESLQRINGLLTAKTDENRILEQRVMKLEGELKHFSLQSERVNKDLKVQMLINELTSIREELQKTQQEFSAYQEFSTKRLKEENALNKKLRHLAV